MDRKVSQLSPSFSYPTSLYMGQSHLSYQYVNMNNAPNELLNVNMHQGFAYDTTISELDAEFYQGLELEVRDFAFLTKYQVDPSRLNNVSGDERDKVPSLKYIDEWIKALTENDMLLVQGGTAFGKTVGMACVFAGTGQQALINEPKRDIATGVAQYVHKKFNSRFGGKPYGKGVGHIIKGNANANQHADVIYLTDGIGIKKVAELIENGELDGKIIAIDEFHERNQNMDILLLMLMRARAQGHKFKIVISSATINTTQLLEYFDKLFSRESEINPKFTIPRVGLLQFPSLRKHEVYIKTGEPSEEIPTLVAQVKKSLTQLGKSKDKPTFLVFRQGKKAIDQAIWEIKSLLAQEGLAEKVQVVGMHGGMEHEELEYAKQDFKKPVIRVSTNRRGSGVTPNNLQWVSTNAIVKRKVVRGGFNQLIEQPLTQDEVLQFLGRGGRTNPTMAFLPNISRNKPFSLQNHERFALPEVLRTKPSSLLFTLTNIGLLDHRQDLIDAPTPEQMEDAKQELLLLGLIDKEGRPTQIGKEIDAMGVDYRIGVCLVEAAKYGKTKEMIELLACQEIDLRPKKGKDGENQKFDGKFYDDDSHAFTQLNVYKSIIQESKKLQQEIRDIEKEMLNCEITSTNEKNYNNIIKGLSKRLREKESQLKSILEDHKVGYMQRQELRNSISSLNRTVHDSEYLQRIHKTQIAENITEKDILLSCLLKGNLDKIRISGVDLKKRQHGNAEREKRTGTFKIADNTRYPTRKGYKEGLTNVTILDIKHLLLSSPEHFSEGDSHYEFDRTQQKVNRYIHRLFLGIGTSTYAEGLPEQDKAVWTFAGQLSRYHNQFEMDVEEETNILRAATAGLSEYNTSIIDAFNNICIKINQSERRIEDKYKFLQDYYFEILYSHNIDSTERLFTFLKNYGSLLKLDDISRMVHNYESNMQKYPDFVQLHNKTHKVTYKVESNYNYSTYTYEKINLAIVDIDDHDDIENIGQEDLNTLFPDKTVRVKLTTANQTTQINNIDEYKQGLLDKQKQQVRKEFCTKSEPFEEHQYSAEQDAFTVREEQVDETLGLYAYRGAEGGENTYSWKPYLDKNEAERTTNNTNDLLNRRKYAQEKKLLALQQLPSIREKFALLKQEYETHNFYEDGRIEYTERYMLSVESEYYESDRDNLTRGMNRLEHYYLQYQQCTVGQQLEEIFQELHKIDRYEDTESYQNVKNKHRACNDFSHGYGNYDYDTIAGYINLLKSTIPTIQQEAQGSISAIQVRYNTLKKDYDNLMNELIGLENTVGYQTLANDAELMYTLKTLYQDHNNRRGGGDSQVRLSGTQLPIYELKPIESFNEALINRLNSKLDIIDRVIDELQDRKNHRINQDNKKRQEPVNKPSVAASADSLQALVDMFRK